LAENDIAIDEWRNKIYVADQTSNQVVVIDGLTNAMTTIPGTGSYLWKVAVNPLTNEVYAANLISNNASIYSAAPSPLPLELLEFLQK
jgi:YVTN family beta-propeller protein